MPRIRVRTCDGERIVGTPNCSTLTIRLDAYAQRSSLKLRADAQLIGGNVVIEHWAWDFAELPDRTIIELISEPETGLAVRYDIPDASLMPKVPVLAEADGQSLSEIKAAEKELADLEAQLKAIGATRIGPPPRRSVASQQGEAPTIYCSFCGKGQDEVRKLVAGPAVFICDECVQGAINIMFD